MGLLLHGNISVVFGGPLQDIDYDLVLVAPGLICRIGERYDVLLPFAALRLFE